MPLFDDDDFDDGTFSLNDDSGDQGGPPDGDGGAGPDRELLQQVNDELITLVEVLLQRFVGGSDEGRFSYSYGEGWEEDESEDEIHQLRTRDPEGQLEVIRQLLDRYR